MTTAPVKTTPASEKKDVQKLQRAIVDGLEDVKAQDIEVYDTEHITALFERVIIASGTSNRQTKALAASVRDSVRAAGFGNPRVEGEDNGEWIIVDCGAAVAHIMQPTIRQYYHLEELWGDKPVKTKLGAVAPAARKLPVASAAPAQVPARKKPGTTRVAAKSALVKKAPISTSGDTSYVGRVGKTTDWTAKRNAADTAREPVARKVAVKKSPVKKTTTTASATPTGKRIKTVVIQTSTRPPKAVAKKVPAKPVGKSAVKPAARTAVKPAAKKVAAKKTPARKSPGGR